MSKEKLYELSHDLSLITDELEENGGVLDAVIEQRLNELSMSFTDKVLSIARWCKNLEGMEDMIDAEIKRLQARKKARENLRERLKEYVKLNMERVGKTKIEYPAFNVCIQANPPSMEIQDEKAIPVKFLTITTIVDRKAVLEALKKGEDVSGAVLIKDKTHLRLR